MTEISITQVSTETLIPADYNPREMDDQSFARLKRGIENFGLVDPIIARRSDNMVIGGHQRLRAARDLGQTHR
jgi:ParB-like chromosome segregation protein Spo0J